MKNSELNGRKRQRPQAADTEERMRVREAWAVREKPDANKSSRRRGIDEKFQAFHLYRFQGSGGAKRDHVGV